MLTERQKQIVQYASEVKFVKVEQLAEMFHVSSETIRRDLLELESEAAIRRVRGGAVYNAMRAREVEFEKKMVNRQEEKLAISRLAVDSIYDGEVIMLSNGSNNIMFAHELAKKRNNLTIITNSYEASAILNQNPTHKVILTGGVIRKHNQSIVGNLCIDCLDRFRADKAVVNIDGFSVEWGVTEFNMEEAAVIQKMLLMSHTRIILCDYAKFNEVAMNRVCHAEMIDIVFTDWNVPVKEIKALSDMGIKVYSADKVN